jgi:1-acyl-sn-glycerol-3-phosphate acyltransferase
MAPPERRAPDRREADVIAVRSLVFNVLFFTGTAVMLLLMWVLLPFPRMAIQRVVTLWGQTMRWLLRTVVGLGFEVRGREHLPDGPAVFACKHQSAWDIFIFYELVSDPAYVLKKELMRIPFWGWYATKVRVIVVDRKGGGAALKRMMRDALATLAAGRHVVIFPEGTRTAPGQRRPYQPGVYAIYAEGVAPVIPVAVNSGLFWGRRSFVKRPGVITLEILPAMPPGLDRRAFMAELENRIESATARLVAEARQRFPGLPAADDGCGVSAPPCAPTSP